jgi:CBS domain-containing protein
MTDERTDAIPVVDASGRTVGLITAGDIVKAVASIDFPASLVAQPDDCELSND